jgi:hypothetical protein
MMTDYPTERNLAGLQPENLHAGGNGELSFTLADRELYGNVGSGLHRIPAPQLE